MRNRDASRFSSTEEDREAAEIKLQEWIKKGNRKKLEADSLSHIRIYWKNGGNMLKLVHQQKKEETEEKQEEEKYFSASEILSWEKKNSKTNEKANAIKLFADNIAKNSKICAFTAKTC